MPKARRHAVSPGPSGRTAAHPMTRRTLLASSTGALAASLLPDRLFGQEAQPQAPADPTKVQGAPASDLGQRSQFEQPRRTYFSQRRTSSRTPLQDLDGIITPSDLHFERHHGGVPTIDPEQYSLLIHGMVERPTVFTLADLKQFPSRSMLRFMECSGNGGNAYRGERSREDLTPQGIDGLTSTSEWFGVPLATLFREVGANPNATWFLAEGMDASVMTRSVPMSKAWDDALIAYGQNGEALRPEQGYPARLFLPGFEGNASVKWLRRLELADQPFMTREETSKYTDPLPDGTARQFSFVMDAKSLITFPAYPTKLTTHGWWEITGLAWSGRGKITQVDVSVNGGETWAQAELDETVLSKCHTRFRLPWNWQGEEAHLVSRATDETGYTQPTRTELSAVRGPNTSYHFNNIRGWRVRSDGTTAFERLA